MNVLINVRRYGLYSTLGLAARLTIMRMFRSYMTLTLGEINATVTASFNDANAAISELLGLGDIKIEELRREYFQILEVIENQLKGTALRYLENYGVEIKSSFLIYSVVRTVKPEVFLETGVANGMSSTIILTGMYSNGNGKLISFDVSDDVGQIIPLDLRKRWELRLLENPLRASFLKELNSIRSVNAFFHDSDQTFKWQSFEFNEAWGNPSYLHTLHLIFLSI
ncbi:MAG: hypothetical protein QXO75_10765 [Nitrososphaerota archaeon]